MEPWQRCRSFFLPNGMLESPELLALSFVSLSQSNNPQVESHSTSFGLATKPLLVFWISTHFFARSFRLSRCFGPVGLSKKEQRLLNENTQKGRRNSLCLA